MWPYSYDSCDIGTLANQTTTDGTGPAAALTSGADDGPISFLPGQRTSACTCPGEDHPGPSVGVGRSSPEIDMIEGQVLIDEGVGEMSQSYQLAPFDESYTIRNVTPYVEIFDNDVTQFNSYVGGVYQQSASALSKVQPTYYDLGSGEFTMFGFEYFSNKADRSSGYITWYSADKESWTLHADAIGPNAGTQIGRRIITEEPMSMVSVVQTGTGEKAELTTADLQLGRCE
jgi:beta-glucanase (GH16 family)